MGKLKVILAVLFVVICLALVVSAIYNTEGQHPINDEAVLLEDSMIVINWDASEETWEQAHAKWLELKQRRSK